MIFKDQLHDGPRFDELFETEVLRKELWFSFNLPLEGNLIDVLLLNGDCIQIKPWIDWLVADHDFGYIPGVLFAQSVIDEWFKSDANNCTTILRAGFIPIYKSAFSVQIVTCLPPSKKEQNILSILEHNKIIQFMALPPISMNPLRNMVLNELGVGA